MQYNPSEQYSPLQESQDDQRQRYPNIQPMNGQQIPFQPYFMPMQPNQPMMYPMYYPQIQQGQIPQGQPFTNVQGVPQVPMFYMPAQIVQEPVDNSPSLVEIIRNLTPEAFYKSLLRLSIAVAFLVFFCLCWLSGHGYVRYWCAKMMAFNLAFNVFVALSGLRALRCQQNKRFKRHMKLTYAFFVICIYRMVTGVFMWGIGFSTLVNIFFFLQSGYLCCKGKKFYKLVKKEWKQKNANRSQPNVEAQQGSA